MPRRSVLHVHAILLDMIKQYFIVPDTSSKGRRESEVSHVWQIRHAGLLGIKYEVAVRNDLFATSPKVEDGPKDDTVSKELLEGVVDAAVLG